MLGALKTRSGASSSASGVGGVGGVGGVAGGGGVVGTKGLCGDEGPLSASLATFVASNCDTKATTLGGEDMTKAV